MKLNFKNVDKSWKTYALSGCICILFCVVLIKLGSIFAFIGRVLGMFSTVFLGAIIAYIANPLASFFSRKLFFKIKKSQLQWLLSVTLAALVYVAVIVILLALVIPQIVDSMVYIVDNISRFIEDLREDSLSVSIGDSVILRQIRDYLYGEDGLVDRLGSILTDNIQNILKITTSVGSRAASGGIAVILAIYFLLAKSTINESFSKLFTLLFSHERFIKLNTVLTKFNGIFSKYIVCEILDAIIVGLANYIFMMVISAPSAAFVSVVIGVTNLVPTFGPLVGAGFGVLVLLLLDSSYILPLLIFTLVLQTLDGYVIKPKLFGDALNVPGLIILIFILVFGKMLGVAGMLIAIPAAAIFIYLYDEAFIPWLEQRRNIANEKEAAGTDTVTENNASEEA